MARDYALGAVKPFVADAAQEFGTKFNLTTIYGWRATANDMTGHPAGLAIDMPIATDRAKGDAIAAYATANASRLMVKYVIWQQRIWKPSAPTWALMATQGGDRPGYDPNHLRHVHVSFLADVSDGRRLQGASAGGVTPVSNDVGDSQAANTPDAPSNPIEAVQQGLTSLGDGIRTFTSADTWRRVLYVVGGLYCVTWGVLLITKDLWAPAAKTAATAAIPGGAVVKGAAAAASLAKGK